MNLAPCVGAQMGASHPLSCAGQREGSEALAHSKPDVLPRARLQPHAPLLSPRSLSPPGVSLSRLGDYTLLHECGFSVRFEEADSVGDRTLLCEWLAL